MDRPGVRQVLALVVGMPLAALVIVVLGAAVPDRLVLDRLHDAVVEGQMSETQYLRGASGGVIDRHSECKRMTIGLGAESGNPVAVAVRSPTLGSCEPAVAKIIGWADGEGLTRSYEYFRYWHGGAAVLRPLIVALGVAGTRVLAATGLAIAAGALWWTVRARAGALAATLFLGPLVATTDFIDLHQMLVHAIGAIVALGAAALVVSRVPADAPPLTFAMAAFISGGAFLFFADLTNPDAAWALTTVAAALACCSLDARPAAVRLGAAAGGWLAGFAWLWFAKWLIAVPVVGYAAVRRSVGDQIDERLNAEVDGMDNGRTAGLARAWREWWDLPSTWPLLIALVVVALVVVVRRREVASTWRPRLLLAAPALIPVVWHVVMKNHTLVHGWFTYRSFAVAAGAVLLAATTRVARTADDQANVGLGASGSMP